MNVGTDRAPITNGNDGKFEIASLSFFDLMGGKEKERIGGRLVGGNDISRMDGCNLGNKNPIHQHKQECVRVCCSSFLRDHTKKNKNKKTQLKSMGFFDVLRKVILKISNLNPR